MTVELISETWRSHVNLREGQLAVGVITSKTPATEATSWTDSALPWVGLSGDGWD